MSSKASAEIPLSSEQGGKPKGKKWANEDKPENKRLYDAKYPQYPEPKSSSVRPVKFIAMHKILLAGRTVKTNEIYAHLAESFDREKWALGTHPYQKNVRTSWQQTVRAKLSGERLDSPGVDLLPVGSDPTTPLPESERLFILEKREGMSYWGINPKVDVQATLAKYLKWLASYRSRDIENLMDPACLPKEPTTERGSDNTNSGPAAGPLPPSSPPSSPSSSKRALSSNSEQRAAKRRRTSSESRPSPEVNGLPQMSGLTLRTASQKTSSDGTPLPPGAPDPQISLPDPKPKATGNTPLPGEARLRIRLPDGKPSKPSGDNSSTAEPTTQRPTKRRRQPKVKVRAEVETSKALAQPKPLVSTTAAASPVDNPQAAERHPQPQAPQSGVLTATISSASPADDFPYPYYVRQSKPQLPPLLSSPPRSSPPPEWSKYPPPHPPPNPNLPAMNTTFTRQSHTE